MMSFLKRPASKPATEKADDVGLILPALRTTLTLKRAQHDFAESCVIDRDQEAISLYLQRQRVIQIAEEKRRLARQLSDEVASLERMIREIEG